MIERFFAFIYIRDPLFNINKLLRDIGFPGELALLLFQRNLLLTLSRAYTLPCISLSV